MPDSNPPDFANGIPVTELNDGQMIQGSVFGEDVLLARRGQEFFAVGASCTHYGGPLAEGLLVGDQVRCPLHHACFSLRTGEALRRPAFDAIACWRVDRVGDRVFVREKIAPPPSPRPSLGSAPSSVVIVGGGAAGLAAADMLRREGYERSITILSADDAAPYDRPNLSKDYLAGSAPEEWMPLRSPDYYNERRIELLLRSQVTSIDVERKRVHLADGKSLEFGALLLATGAEPVHLAIPGADGSNSFYIRTMTDGRTLAGRVASAKKVVVVGAGFIGLEAAAALRERKIEVHVVAHDKLPLERVFGAEVGAFIRSLHESHGVTFHLGKTVERWERGKAILREGGAIDTDLLVIGVGVSPSTELAEKAGLRTDRGILVDEYLETSAPGIFAAGDVARFPDPYSGQHVRIEHWVVAERQGQTAARNLLGLRERYASVPFFWTQQYGLSIRSIGHAEKWDGIEVEGSLERQDAAVSYKLGGRTVALVTLGRDRRNLEWEAELESSLRSRSLAGGRGAD